MPNNLRSINYPVISGGVASPLLADMFVDMNVVDLPGTLLTTAIVAAGTHGVYTSNTQTPTPDTGYVVGAHVANRTLHTAVKVVAITYPTTNPSKALSLDNTHNNTYQGFIIPTNKMSCTIAGFVKLGPPDVGAASVLFDMANIHTAASGNFCVFQLNNGDGGAGYRLFMETNPLGVTTHSPPITAVPGATYWFSMFADFTNGVCNLRIFDVTTWAQLGNVSSTCSVNPGTDYIDRIDFGNNEVGTAATTTEFENLLINYSNPVQPLGP